MQIDIVPRLSLQYREGEDATAACLDVELDYVKRRVLFRVRHCKHVVWPRASSDGGLDRGWAR